MPRPDCIELPGVEPIRILYEDRSVLAIDKPRGWMLVPFSWRKTKRNLQAALTSSIAAGDFWARSRGLKFLRFVHRLDADTTGVLLFVKSRSGLPAYSDLFESRRIEKTYLAVVHGVPRQGEWTCRLRLAPGPQQVERVQVDARHGKEAATNFRLLQAGEATSLLEAHPLTGRKHQIRVHLAESGCPVVGDELYGRGHDSMGLGLRAIRLAYADPFTRQPVEINAPIEEFCHRYGFAIPVTRDRYGKL